MLPFAILGGCLGVGVLPAFAADQSVGIVDYAFQPRAVAVLPGESVSWQAEGAFPHNVHFEGEPSLGTPDADFAASKSFPTEGEYRYFCDQHPSMRGTVYVNQTGTVPTATPSPTTTATATASPTSSPGSGGSGGAPGGGGSTSGPSPAGSTAVTAFRVRAKSGRRGVVLTLRLGADKAVRVRGTLRRGGKRVRSVSLLVRPGRHRVRLPGKRLKPGRYVLTLRAGELRRTVRFRVRR
jgi:Copper binding proteins, plastocyanin/azurin family